MRRRALLILTLALGACHSGGSSSDADVPFDGAMPDDLWPPPHHTDPEDEADGGVVREDFFDLTDLLVPPGPPPKPVNTAPAMNVLNDTTGPVGLPFTAYAHCTDDGYPKPASLTYQWTMTDNTGSCVLESPTSEKTIVKCDALGSISLTITCCEQGPANACTGLSTSSTFDVTIREPLMLDLLAAMPGGPIGRGAYLISHNVSAAYSGPSIRIRRASDNALLDIGFVNDRLDEDAIEAHCAGSSCFIVTNFDKSSNGRHITQPNPAGQPMIYDAETGLIRRGSLPCAKFVSPNGKLLQSWSRPDILGFGLQPSISTFYLAQYGFLSNAGRVAASVGGNGSQAFAVGSMTNGDLAVGVSNYGFDVVGNRRTFTPQQDITGGVAHYLASLASGGYVPSMTLRQNGVLLTESSPGDALLQHNDGTVSGVGSSNVPNANFDGLMDGVIFFEGVVAGDALEMVKDFGDELVELAEGQKPPPADLSKMPRYIVVAGQSNAALLSVPTRDYTPRYGDIIIKIAVGSTALGRGDWVPGGAEFNLMVETLKRLDKNIPIDIWWVLGETDAAYADDAVQYAANMTRLDESMQAASGRTFNWLDTYLHSEGTATYRAEVNEQKAIFGATIPDRYRVIDPTPYGSLMDPLHWDPELGEAMMNAAVQTINVEYPHVYTGNHHEAPH